MRHEIFIWKTPTNSGDKKPLGLRPTSLNPLLQIKLQRFTLPLFTQKA